MAPWELWPFMGRGVAESSAHPAGRWCPASRPLWMAPSPIPFVFFFSSYFPGSFLSYTPISAKNPRLARELSGFCGQQPFRIQWDPHSEAGRSLPLVDRCPCSHSRVCQRCQHRGWPRDRCWSLLCVRGRGCGCPSKHTPWSVSGLAACLASPPFCSHILSGDPHRAGGSH